VSKAYKLPASMHLPASQVDQRILRSVFVQLHKPRIRAYPGQSAHSSSPIMKATLALLILASLLISLVLATPAPGDEKGIDLENSLAVLGN
jgi:hypothetical protein